MKQEIEKLEEELRLAMLFSDVEKLDLLIADELRFIAPNGAVVTKQMDLDIHKSGQQKMSKLTPSERQIKVFDNCASVTVKMEVECMVGETRVSSDYRYTRTWAKINGLWQVIAGAVVAISS